MMSVADDHRSPLMMSVADDLTDDARQAEYLRTLELDHYRSLALVHWWYLPDSRDEWIPEGASFGWV